MRGGQSAGSVSFQALLGMLVRGKSEGMCGGGGGAGLVTILLKMSVSTGAARRAKRRLPAANWHAERSILRVSPAALTERRRTS